MIKGDDNLSGGSNCADGTAGGMPMAARTGVSSPFGKITYDVGRLMLPQLVGEKLAERAHAEGIGLLEYIRERCVVDAFGEAHVINVQMDRIRRMDKIWKESGSATADTGTQP